MRASNRNQLNGGIVLLRFGIRLGVSLAALSLLSGCGGEAQRISAAGKVRISVSTGPKEGETNRQRMMDHRLALFAERYPDIEVEVSSWEYSPESFLSKMAGGTCPDIVNTWATEGPLILDQNLAWDLTEWFRRWEASEAVRPLILSPFVRDGRVYGFPISAYSMALYYNKSRFREAGIVDESGEARPPETWVELAETAKRLTDPEANRFGFAITGAQPQAGWHFLNWAWQAGGDFEEKTEEGWRAVFDRPPVVQALQFLKDLRWTHRCVPSDAFLEPEEVARMFVAGGTAMMIEPANENSILILSDRYGFDLKELGIAPLPAGPAGRATQFGADYYIINSHVPKEKLEACFAWLTFTVSPEWIAGREALKAEIGLPAGAPDVPIFTGARAQEWESILARYRNIPAFEKYTSTVTETLRAEPPYFCQQLYSEALSPVVQQVIADPQADPARLLREHARRFQQAFLDQLN